MLLKIELPNNTCNPEAEDLNCHGEWFIQNSTSTEHGINLHWSNFPPNHFLSLNKRSLSFVPFRPSAAFPPPAVRITQRTQFSTEIPSKLESKSDEDTKKYRSRVESFTPWQMPVLVVGSYLLPPPRSLPPFPPGSSHDARFWRSTISSEDICRDARRRIAERGPVVSAMQINTCAQYNSSRAVKVIRRRCINWHDGA